MENIVKRVLSFLRPGGQDPDPNAVQRLCDYFAVPMTPRAGKASDAYTGRAFEALGRGDAPEVRDVITAEDLVALQMLSVTVPAETSYQLLRGDLGRQVNELLREIPVGVRLGTEEAEPHIEDRSPAGEIWKLLGEGQRWGMGKTKRSKLLARKRPDLIPVYDAVVGCALGNPERIWDTFHEVMANGDVQASVEALRTAANISDLVSDLRVVDVVIWTGHISDHKNCQP